jgi:hypothetical protein
MNKPWFVVYNLGKLATLHFASPAGSPARDTLAERVTCVEGGVDTVGRLAYQLNSPWRNRNDVDRSVSNLRVLSIFPVP